MKKKSTTTGSLQDGYRDLGALTLSILEKLPEGVVIDDGRFVRVEGDSDKKVGMTVGKIVRMLTSEEVTKISAEEFDLGKDRVTRAVDGDASPMHLLVKKSNRYQDIEEGSGIIINKDLSRDMTLDGLREGIKASCTEICAAELFRVLKKQEGYLPKFFLVTSQFDPEKASNRLKRGTGAVKVYVASEIIGDPRAVNNGNGTAQVRSLLDTAENKDLLKEDLLENDIIMFLISNYDVKLDNFIPRGDHLIPIDFGNARAEEPLSCDVVSGIDMIRQTKKKHDSSRYASKELRDRFEGGEYISTQSFCKKNLAPEHFLKFIAKVKENQPELERQLYDTAMLYSFGREEEKREYADVVVSRLRNLVELEPILVEYVRKSGGSSFQNQDLRQIISRSQQFRDDLLNTNHSPGKDFFRFINALFESIDQKSDKLIQSLEHYQEASSEEAKSEHSADILKQVEYFNEDLLEKRKEVASRTKSLREYYNDSDYMSGRNKLGRGEDWRSEQQKIGNKIDEIMETLEAPLIEGDMVFGDAAEEFDNESSLKAGCDWDLAKASVEYLEKMNSFKEYAKDSHKEIDSSLRLLTTHLVAHDTLINLRRERVEALGKEEAFSFQPPRPPSPAVSALSIKDGVGREGTMEKGGGKVKLNADGTEIIH